MAALSRTNTAIYPIGNTLRLLVIKKMKTYWLSALCVSLLWLSGCDGTQQPTDLVIEDRDNPIQTQADADESDSESAVSEPATPATESTDDLTPTDANTEFFVIDVRSADEFAAENVEGSINIPHTEIVEGIKQVTEDKGAKICFY